MSVLSLNVRSAVATLLLAGCPGKESGAPETDANTDTDTDADADADSDTDTDTDADTDTDTDSDTDTDTEPVEINDVLVLPKGRPKNLVVITVDTLRRDHVNALGYSERITTPMIDRFFEEGVGLYNHRSCSSWTLTSFLCAMTGQDLLSLGHWPLNLTGSLPEETPDDITLMSEYFQDRGFYTMIYAASGFLGTSANMLQGYDDGLGMFEPAAPTVVAEAWDLLEDRPDDQPFYLHAHFIDPHMPYIPPESYLKELESLEPTTYDYSTEEGTLVAWIAFPTLGESAQEVNLQHMAVRYDAEILYADEQIERLLFADDSPLADELDDTLVLFYVDHGEEFWEHDNFNHGYNNFEEVVRSSAAIWWPGGLEPAQIDTITLHEDLLPTIFAIFGFDPDPAFTGEIVGDATDRTEVHNLVFREEKTHQSVTDGAEKLMFRWDDSDLLGGPKYFYDLTVDPTEQNNLYDPTDPRVLYWWKLLLPKVEQLDDAEKDLAPVNPGP